MSTTDSTLLASFLEVDMTDKDTVTLNKRRVGVGETLNSNCVIFEVSMPSFKLSSCIKRFMILADIMSIPALIENEIVVSYRYKHISSDTAPAFGQKLIDEHDEHKRFPVSFLNFPATHSTHKSMALDISRPAGHRQLLMLLPAMGPSECSGQLLQLFTAFPVVFEYWFNKHPVHSWFPVWVLYFPATHEVHVFALLCV